jgi:hypothetical protein
MTVREIRGHLEELYGIEVSPDLISAVTDAVLDEVAEGTVGNLVWGHNDENRSIIWRSRKTCWTSYWPGAIRRTYSIKMGWSTN